MRTDETVAALAGAAETVAIDLSEGIQIIGAARLAGRRHPPLDPGAPALVLGFADRTRAQAVRRALGNAYPDDHPVQLICRDGSGARSSIALRLAELGGPVEMDACESLYLPALPHGGFADLQEVTARLRAPDGCPWDREQTLASLRAYLLDETCEALEAMDARDDAHVAEELGDVLGIIAMIAQIAAEEDRFRLADAVRLSVEKLIRRHPHVFGEERVEDMAELYERWEKIKAEERAAGGRPQPGPLDAVPAALPALRKAREMQSKAAGAGLLDRTALAQAGKELARLLPRAGGEEALGLLLWRLVAVAAARGLDAEDALRAFIVRWRAGAAGKASPQG